ncbi:MAG: hypothetical protein R8K20_02635 [Gallionellaceae bacterium]
MENATGISLKSYLLNNMKVGGDLGWFMNKGNASTSYYWSFIPDNSGVY